MKPSTYIQEYGSYKDIEGLQRVLFAYEQLNADDIEQLKAITPKEKMSQQTMQKINEYELEVRVGSEALNLWKEDK